LTLLQGVGALMILAFVFVVFWVRVVHPRRESPAQAISRLTGRSLSCSSVGVVALKAGPATVLLCSDATGYRGLWAARGNAVSDVTKEVCAMKNPGTC
jgi:hypothetical protein